MTTCSVHYIADISAIDFDLDQREFKFGYPPCVAASRQRFDESQSSSFKIGVLYYDLWRRYIQLIRTRNLMLQTCSKSICVAISFLVLTACASKEKAVDQQALISDGRPIAEAQCAACHAVGPYGESANPAAPKFRQVLSRYPAGLLEENLIQGVQVAHPMPEFQFNPVGVDALVAYLRSIQEPSSFGGAGS